MNLKASDIIEILEQWAPPGLQEDWDNSGLCIGHPDTPVTGVLVCLDCTKEILEEAMAEGLNMIVSHHPLIFRGLKHIRDISPVEQTVALAIRKNLLVYSMHTNADKIMDGVSGAMARALSLINVSILSLDKICENNTEPCGLGVVGDLPEPIPTEKFLDLVKKVFHTPVLKVSEIFHPILSRVALCGGSGSSLIADAMRSGAQVFVSADFSYHAYFETIPNMMLVDAGHYESEAGVQDEVCRVLRKKFPTFAVRKTRINTNPIRFY
ncbi:MAG: Nif3-like dinuclear metal center hexameric protein [Bacteroidales bacterium]|jgi:dinuclear metal center YbgI/SA1388 family protein